VGVTSSSTALPPCLFSCRPLFVSDSERREYPHSCYLRGTVLQRMVENHERGVCDGRPVKHWTRQYTRPDLLQIGWVSAYIAPINMYSRDEDLPGGSERTI